MKVTARDIATICILAILIVFSLIMNIRNGYFYDMTVSSGPRALGAEFYNWWIILAFSIALLYGILKTLYLQKGTWKMAVPILSAGLLFYSMVSLFLFSHNGI